METERSTPVEPTELENPEASAVIMVVPRLSHAWEKSVAIDSSVTSSGTPVAVACARSEIWRRMA